MELLHPDFGEKEAKQLRSHLENGVKIIPTETAKVFFPDESTPNYFNLYVNMASFRDRVFMVWASSSLHEDDCGQKIMISSCGEDFVWSTAETVVDTVRGNRCNLTFFSPVLYSDGKKLVLYYTSIEWKEELLSAPDQRPLSNQNYGEKTFWRKVSDDGFFWSKPEKMFENRQICANDAPIRDGTGLRWACNRSVLFSGIPDGTGEFRVVAEINAKEAITRGAKTLMESGMFKQNGIYYMTFRSNTEYLWASVSVDGENWSPAYPTAFTDAKSLCKFLKAPDGRILYVGCSDPADKPRNRLMLCVSKPGSTDFTENYAIKTADENTYQMKKSGFCKGGTYNYPDSLIANGYLYVAYALQKEAIEAVRIPLDQICSPM